MPIPQLTGPQTRDYSFSRAKIDEEKRTVELSFASTTPVPRWFGLEILSFERGAADLTRLNNGGALLLDHDRTKQIGVIEWAKADGAKARAKVRFSKSPLGEEIFRDVMDGIRSLVSFSYEAGKIEKAQDVDGQEAFSVRQWKALEISIVSIPADPNVGVGRSYQENHMDPNQDHIDPETGYDTRSTIVQSHLRELRENGTGPKEYENTMRMIGRAAGLTDAEVNRSIVGGQSIESFRKFAMSKRPPAQPIGEAERRPELDGERFGPLGLSERDIQDYSILRALRCLTSDRRENCKELEISRDCEKKYGPLNGSAGFRIPDEISTHRREIQRRDMTAGSFTAGGVFIGNQEMSMIDKLRSEPICAKLGARVIPGLVGNVTWPTLTTDSTAAFYAENGDISESTPAFGQLAMTPKRQGALGEVSRKLLAQTSGEAENIFRQNMLTVMAIGIDAAIINGTGANAQPLGIMGTSGINTVTFSGAATWAKILSFETELATDNVRPVSPAWLCSPATRAKWRAIQRFSSTDTPLWTDENTVAGYRAEASNQLPSGNQCIFGDWSQVYVGNWAQGQSIIIDPYTKATTGLIRIIIENYADVALANVVAMVVSTDTAAA